MTEPSLAREVEALLTGHSLLKVEDGQVLVSVALGPYRQLVAAHAAQEVAHVFERIGIPSKYLSAVTDQAVVVVGEWLALGPDELRVTLAAKVKGLIAETGTQTLDELTAIVIEREWLPPGMARFEVKHRIRSAISRRTDLFRRKGEHVGLTTRGQERSKPKQAPAAPPPQTAPRPLLRPLPRLPPR